MASKLSAKILVIDERAFRRAAIVGLFAPWGETKSVEVSPCGVDVAFEALESPEDFILVVASIGGEPVTGREIKRMLTVLRSLSSSALVVVSDRDDADQIMAALRLGLDGYLPTSMSPELALQACEFIIGGGSFFPPEAMRGLQPQSEQSRAAPLGGGASEPGGAEPVAPALTASGKAGPAKTDPPPLGEDGGEKGDGETSARNGVSGGEHALRPADAVAKAAVAAPARPVMTHRQQEVLDLIRLGQPNKVIARNLGMTEATVKVHVRQILRKLGARNRTQAALRASAIAVKAPAPEAPQPLSTERNALERARFTMSRLATSGAGRRPAPSRI